MAHVISTVIELVNNFTKPSKEAIKSMRAMSVQAKAAGRSIQKAGKFITNAGSGLAKSVTMPIAGIATAAVKTAADFEHSMAAVKSITAASTDEFADMEKQAQELGVTTAWSAKEVAEAMQYTGMAGWGAAENLEGLKGVLDLASASGTDLAKTADIMVKTLGAFKQGAGESAKFADVLTKTCTSAAVSVEDLGESFKYCGPVAKAMDYSVEEISASLGALGNAGIVGSKAGTAIKNAIANMASPSKNMKIAMDELGISITNNDKSMKSWNEVIKNLRSSFEGMNEAQQVAYATQIFGKEGAPAMLAIINTESEAYNKLAKDIAGSAGAAAQAAETRLESLNGQITLLKSALEGAAITIGKKLLPYIKKVVKWAQKATNRFNRLSDTQVNTIMKFAGIAAAAGPAIMAFGKIVTAIGILYKAFGGITAAIASAKGVLPLLASPAGIVIGVLAAIAVAAFLIIKNWDKVKPVLMKVKDAFMSTMPFIKQAVSSAIEAVMPIINTLVDTFKNVMPQAINVVKQVIESVKPTFEILIDSVTQVAFTISHALIGAFKNLKPAIDTIKNIIKAAIPVIGTIFTKSFQAIGGAITKVMPFIQRIASTIGSTLVYAVLKVSPVIKKLGSTFSAVFNGIVAIVKTAGDVLSPVFNAIGSVIKFVMGIIKARVMATFTIVTNVIETSASSIKTVIDGVLKVFNGILDFITGVFTLNWAQAWGGVKDIFVGMFEGLAGILKVPINAVIGLINSAIEGINGISVDIPDAVPVVGGQHIGFNISKIPALAKGTPNWTGGLAQIHEKGGEIIDLPKGSRVYPHDESVSIAKNTSNTRLSMLDTRLMRLENSGKTGEKKEVKITIPKLADQIIVKDKSDIEEIARELAMMLRDTSLNMGVC